MHGVNLSQATTFTVRVMYQPSTSENHLDLGSRLAA